MSSIGLFRADSDSAPAAAESFALLAPVEAPSLRDSSPHMVGLQQFAALFDGSPRRRALLQALRARLERLNGGGLVPLCLLVGGSFVRPDSEPGDLDGLLVYRVRDGADASSIALLRERVAGLDLRYVPGDGGPEILIKMSCFFHTLYQSRDRDGAQPSFLIQLENDR